MNKLIVSTTLGVAVLIGAAYWYAKASDEYRLTHACFQAPDGTWVGVLPRNNEWFCRSMDRWLDDREEYYLRASLRGR